MRCTEEVLDATQKPRADTFWRACKNLPMWFAFCTGEGTEFEILLVELVYQKLSKEHERINCLTHSSKHCHDFIRFTYSQLSLQQETRREKRSKTPLITDIHTTHSDKRKNYPKRLQVLQKRIYSRNRWKRVVQLIISGWRFPIEHILKTLQWSTFRFFEYVDTIISSTHKEE